MTKKERGTTIFLNNFKVKIKDINLLCHGLICDIEHSPNKKQKFRF